jgi:hypothetical protein
MKEQRVELDWKWNLIFFSHWGTTTERAANETATGRFIDVQPVNNRLNAYADMAETIHNELLNLFSIFVSPTNKNESKVSYGRRYLIETPDQVWNKYIGAKEKKAPISALDQLLEQYYESEYQRNELFQAYYLKLIKIEPFVHSSVEEVVAMPISDDDKLAKIYFSDWLKTVMMNEVVDKPIENLKNDLGAFAMSNKPMVVDAVLDEATRIKLESQATLRGSVGGVTALVALQQSVANGLTSTDAAIATVVEIYGIEESIAASMIGAAPKQNIN